jgi:tetratricopeptide (TPR) repeat protein
LSTTAGVRSHDYQFHHALLRDVLYQRLTDLERTHYHVATAEAMMASWGEGSHDGSARIAHHFGQAGDSRLEAEFSMKAGNHALDLQDYALARVLFDRVQDIGPTAGTPFLVTQSLIGLGNCDRADGLLDDAESRFDQAIRLALKQDLPVVHANALTSMAMLDFDAGRMARGTELLSGAVKVLLEFGDHHEASRSLALLSNTLHGSGRYDEAAKRASESIDLASRLGSELLEASGMIALGNCWLDIGLFNDAIATYDSCLDICRRLGNTHRAAICWLNISLASLELGSWERARAALAEVFALANRLNLRMIGAAHFNLALIEELTGNPEQATAGYEASLRIREQVKQSALQVDCRAGLLRIALVRSDDREVRTLIEWIESYLEQNGLEGIEHPGRLHVTLVDAHGALDNRDLQKLALQRGLDMLQHRANLLQDPRHRHVYLHDVPPHRALQDRARSLGLDTDLLRASAD